MSVSASTTGALESTDGTRLVGSEEEEDRHRGGIDLILP